MTEKVQARSMEADLETMLNAAAAIAALIAAGLWIKATRAETPAPPETAGVGGLIGGYLISKNARGERIDLHATYVEQSKWNSRAAWATAMAALIAGSIPASKAIGLLP